MRKAKYFSVCDAKSGFHQIKVAESSKKYTAFFDGHRKLEYNFMPMGLMNAPMFFQMIGDQILGDLDFVIVYIDDICIFSESMEQHSEHIRIVMERLAKYNLKLNPEKCKFFAEKIKILGHVISAEGIEMDPEKINAIIDKKPPNNVKSLEQFLGLANYYRNFIENFADLCAPLYRLKTASQWMWTEECDNSFKSLIKKFTENPILRQADMSKPFIIHADASNEAVGAVLSQIDHF